MMFLLYSNEIFLWCLLDISFGGDILLLLVWGFCFFRVKYFGDLATSNLELIFVIVVGTSIWFSFELSFRVWLLYKNLNGFETSWVECIKVVCGENFSIYLMFLSLLFSFSQQFSTHMMKMGSTVARSPHIDTNYLISAFFKWK